MTQQELAELLDREQQKTASPEKKEAPAKKAASKKTSAKASEEASSEKKAAKPAKKAAKSKAPEKVKAEPSSETASAEVKAPAETSEAPSEKKAASDKKRSKKTKETASEKKEELKEEKAAEEVKTEAEAPSENTSKEKKSRSKKDAKKKEKEEKPSEEKASEKEEKAEEKKEETASENTSTEEKKEVKENPQKQNNQRNQKKSRHRSVEIRPANEAPSSESSEGSAEGSSEGENNPENNKPQIEPIEFVGVLEIVSDGGYGFVRRENYLPSPQDVFVPTNLIRRFGLRIGDQIRGFALPKRGQEKNLALSYITTVNDVEIDKLGKRPHFERLTPIYPDERFRLETGKQELSTRIIDLVSPIGKGQRGMIVSPPKAGKTILLQKIANAITQNSPKTKLIVLLIDERPEEVTDMQRSIKGEVVYSTFDKKPENHTRVTELVLERAMRLVEMGEDVVILLDSMTRLARAYNLTITPTGRTLSGGLDPGSLYGPKRFFGAARNIENGGSLTIVATSLIETGSRMDEVIFEEFKGTGNMEVYLDRKLSEKRIFPAIDINKSGTRREDLLMSQEELDAVWTIRKAFSQMETAPVTETIINLLLRTNSNDHFIRSVKVSFADKEVFDAMRGTGANGNANGN
ncbi:MAG: transcription termination factor Rho [Clostridiales bacterium]|nr:transcription termination factor Rho [Clostridiales bacterium]